MSDPKPDADTQLQQRSRALFDDAVANLDGATRSRLNQARQTALQSVAARPAALRYMVPVGSVAALALVGVVSVQMWQQTHRPADAAAAQTAASGVDDLEIVTTDADLDMLKDMDFYAWVDSQELDTPGAETGAES